MQTTGRLVFGLAIVLLVSTAALNFSRAESPVSQVGIEVGSRHKVVVGMGALEFKVIKLGSEGWVFVELATDAPFVKMRQGEKYWLNVNQLLLISAPLK